MKVIEASVQEQNLVITPAVISVATSVNAYSLKITYDDQWADTDTKLVTFRGANGIAIALRDEGTETGVIIPWEVLQAPGKVTVGVAGYVGSEQKLATTGLYDRNTIVVLPEACGLKEALTPTPDIYQKLIKTINRINARIDDTNTELELAKDDIETLQNDVDTILDQIGDLNDLDTETHNSLVEAINEVLSKIEGGEVTSVNGKTGDVVLTASDVGATTVAYVTEAVAAETEIRQSEDAALHQEINGKQNALTAAQLSAVNSGITSTKVETYDNYATELQGLQTGKQDKLTAGANVQINGATISATDTTYSDFTGTDGVDPGTAGLVPAPETTDADKFLKSDGTWAEAGGGGVTPVQTPGTSTTDVMSQDATTKLIYPDYANTPDKVAIGSGGNLAALQVGAVAIGKNPRATNTDSIAIGTSALAQGQQAVAIGNASGANNMGATAVGRGAKANANDAVAVGFNAGASVNYAVAIGMNSAANGVGGVAIGSSANAAFGGVGVGQNININNSTYGVAVGYGSGTANNTNGAVALGAYSNATRTGEVNVGSSQTAEGFNNTNYRLISGVHDGQDPHDAATVAQGNTLATSAPTTATVGVLGQLYTDTTNMHTYQCTAIDTTDPDNPSYTWTQRW